MAITGEEASRVLVTDANGFISAHIINLLLKHGYYVRGAVRSTKQAHQLGTMYVPLHYSIL